MLVPILRFIFVLVGATAGALFAQYSGVSNYFSLTTGIIFIIACVLVGAGSGFLLGGFIGRRLAKVIVFVEDILQKIPGSDIFFGTIGLIVGLLVAYLISPPLRQIGVLGIGISVFLFIFFALLGIYLSLRKKEDLAGVVQGIADEKKGRLSLRSKVSRPKILDTSTIIDGRIADICQTGFIEGRISIPNFVLKELQAIADSKDELRRKRGRRGLDILKSLQTDSSVDVVIFDKDYPDIKDVDSKLVRLARDEKGVLMTNDFNLNKVAKLQGVKVLNVNSLANAVKTLVIPGEELELQLSRQGKEKNQGIGYLDDGTMVVVENGKNHLGKNVRIIVTSVIQTPAGRMIFGEFK